MSSVLERMVRQARAPLSAVEPLFQSRYAPVTAAAQPPQHSLTEIDEAVSEAESSPQALSAVRPTLPPPVPRVSVGEDPARTFNSVPDPAPQDAPSQPRARDLFPDGQRKSGPSHPSHPPYRLASRPSPEPGSAEADPPVSRPVADTPVVPRSQPTPVLGRAEPALPPPGDSNIAPQQQTSHYPTEPASRLPRDRPAASPRLMPHSPWVDAPAATAPDVTISIGHIEVRAPQVAERPRRPAFRPRVSLDDFLNRRQGERS
jgi:hypothetical protein